MNATQLPKPAEAVLTSLTEPQMAHWCRELGNVVICRHGRHWMRTCWGFFEPVHWLAGLQAEQARKPSLACWGFRATLAQEAAARANGSMPVYLLSDVRGYCPEGLPAKRRNDFRRCQKQVNIVPFSQTGPLGPQWHQVAVSAALRNGRNMPGKREEYLRSLEPFLRDRRRLVLGGLVNGNLAGWLSGYAVEDVAYIEMVILATEYLSTAVGTGLVVKFVQACQQVPEIQRIVYGQHSLEDANLTRFKEGMGFPVVQVPCRVHITQPLGNLIRWRFPYKFYRLTGLSPQPGIP